MSTTNQEISPRTLSDRQGPAQRFRFELRASDGKRPRSRRQQKRRFPPSLIFPILFGVVLPVATLAIEYESRLCAGTFFDPIPSGWHILLVAWVPVANLAAAWAVLKRRCAKPKLLLLANAAAVGIAGAYSLVFLPLTPLALVAVLVYGLGLLALAPLLSLIATLVLRRSLRRQLATSRPGMALPRVWAGVGIAIVALLLAEVPAAVTRIGLHRASSKDPQESRAGVRLLRILGDRDELLRACYRQRNRALDLLGPVFSFAEPVSTTKAREVYYLVTGEAFEAAPRPAFSMRGLMAFDPEQGGTEVGAGVEGLSLAHSRLDGSIDSKGALGYLEWTMVIRNDQAVQREARAQVKLPAGSVVSRVTLWINGEEREAAFGPRGQVREAYERVVQARRDPLLVTTTGPDQVLIQCFPVPAGGEMKIRIGITFPLEVRDEQTLALPLPHFVEKNFATPEKGPEVWLEADVPFESFAGGLSREQTPDGAHALRGTAASVSTASSFVYLRRKANDGFAWTPDPDSSRSHVIEQRIERRSSPPLRRIVIVVDGSAGMNPFLKDIAEELSAVPRHVQTEIVLAADEVVRLGNDASQLLEMRGEGGADSVPALLAAYDRAAAEPESVILWIHGAQPVLLDRPDGLRSTWARSPGRPLLFALQVQAGPNRVLEALGDLPEVQSVSRAGDLRADLARLFARWTNRATEAVLVRERIARAESSVGTSGAETSPHLARLWANDEVIRLSRSRSKSDREAAVALAMRYQIVTPVSGAVVLESQAQYEQAGLEPADPASVPTIPEPEVWMLMLVSTALLSWKLFRGRPSWTSV